MSHRVRYVALLFWRLLASLGDADKIQIGHLVGWHCPQARDAAREGEAAQVAQVERLTRELEEAHQAAADLRAGASCSHSVTPCAQRCIGSWITCACT